jgi:hypothetical protein
MPVSPEAFQFHPPCEATSTSNRWSQPLASIITSFEFMKRISMLATLAAASGGSALSR